MANFGKINFADLQRLLWRSAEHFGVFQDYILTHLSELSTSRAGSGVVYGCGVTAQSALTVRVAAGLVIFPNGLMVSVDQQDITLPTADGSNPRLDRIELAYSLVNGVSVTTIDNQSKVLDKIHTATVQANVGTPNASPVAPVKTSGRLSLAVVRVNAAQVSLSGGSISQVEDTSREISALKWSDGTSRMRFNASKGWFEVSEDGSTWKQIVVQSADSLTQALVNNTGPLDVTGVLFDKTKVVGAEMKVQVAIKTDAPTELVEQGVLRVAYLPQSDAWADPIFNSDFGDAGVTFSITAGGQLQYTSSNVAGANYVGKLRITDIVAFRA